METLQQTRSDPRAVTLSERVDELLRPDGARPLLSTTGPQAAVSQLDQRTRALEQAIREIAREVQNLAASH